MFINPIYLNSFKGIIAEISLDFYIVSFHLTCSAPSKFPHKEIMTENIETCRFAY